MYRLIGRMYVVSPLETVQTDMAEEMEKAQKDVEQLSVPPLCVCFRALLLCNNLVVAVRFIGPPRCRGRCVCPHPIPFVFPFDLSPALGVWQTTKASLETRLEGCEADFRTLFNQIQREGGGSTS